MLTAYKMALGWDIPTVNLTLINPQPRSTGIRVARRSFSISGGILDEGLHIYLQWSVIGTIDQYGNLLEQFDLSTNTSSLVTVQVPEHQFAYNRYNGIAIRPRLGEDVLRDNFFIRNLNLLIKHMEQAAG